MPTKGLKKHLSTLSKEELIKHIQELDKKYKPVQEYHQFFMNQDFEAVIDKYKKQIEYEFYPLRGHPKMRLSVARSAITEANKLGVPAEHLAELMLFYVETGVQFTNDFGDIDERFYSSMESMFLKALQLMDKENLLDNFKERNKKVIDDTIDIGWGFHDVLVDYFYNYYE